MATASPTIDIAELVALPPAHGRRRRSPRSRRRAASARSSSKATWSRSFREKPAGDGGLINGGFFVADPSVLDLIDGPDTVWEQEPLETAGARRRAGRLSPRRLLAADGYAARQDASRRAVANGSAVEMLVKRASGRAAASSSPATPASRAAGCRCGCSQLGAEVTGFALPAADRPEPLRAGAARRAGHAMSKATFATWTRSRRRFAMPRPEVVFHLAAQPLVRFPTTSRSRPMPPTSWARSICSKPAVASTASEAVVCVTTDKCYENREWVWPYRESDPMGGHDPYSSSKGAAELVIAAYRRSFFADGAAIASVRAGNVIGGGDWARDRLVPDIVRALLAGERPLIRNPDSVRPWQHVLEALGGYLLIAERLLAGEREFANAWNFGVLPVMI